MDPIALGTFLRDFGPWGLLAVSLFTNKYLFDKLGEAQTKVEGTLGEWRKDSQAQSDKLTSILEKAAEEQSARRGRS